MPLPIQPNRSPKTLFNLDREEFTFSYDGGKEVYTLPPFGYDTFPTYIADRMASSLADKIISKSGVKKNYELDKKELLAKIYV